MLGPRPQPTISSSIAGMSRVVARNKVPVCVSGKDPADIAGNKSGPIVYIVVVPIPIEANVLGPGR
jgi:hypothetical protein